MLANDFPATHPVDHALGRMRKLIQHADPNVVEEWTWGIPVRSHDGILCTGETC